LAKSSIDTAKELWATFDTFGMQGSFPGCIPGVSRIDEPRLLSGIHFALCGRYFEMLARLTGNI
jgi:hypothetical protein